MTAPDQEPDRSRSVRRVWALVAVLTVLAMLATAGLFDVTVGAGDLLIGAALSICVAVTERWALNARIGHVSQRLTLSEAPLLVGLFLVPGIVLVAARVLGGLIALQVLRRQELHKTAYNLTYLWIETLAVVALFALVRPAGIDDGLRAMGFLIAMATVIACAGALAMAGAMATVHGRVPPSKVLRAARDGLPPSLATTAATTIAYTLTTIDPMLLWAPGVITAVLMLAYRSHVGLLEAQDLGAQLGAITSRITGESSVADTVDRLVQAARTLMDAPDAAVRLPGPDGTPRWHGSEAGTHCDLDHQVTLLDGSHGPGTSCCRDAAPVVAAPVEAIPGAWLAVRFNDRHQIARSDDQAATMLANHASVAITNAMRGSELVSRAEEANHLAHHDSLTGLPNRTALMSVITDAVAADSPFALLLIDLDNFKEINDALGHSAGDSVLTTIANRFAGLDPDLVVGRLGGDEFLAVVRGDEVDARHVADVLRALIGEAIIVGPYNLEVGSSVGISLCPDHGTSVGELLKQADLAMYEAKSRGSGVQTFGEASGGRAMRQLAISSGFRTALANDAIDVAFQPIVDLRTGRPVAVEALARWTHETLGPVNPEEFVHVAEQAGLTAELTARMLEQSLGWLRTWQADGHDLRLSVNLSVRTLMHTGLALMVSGALQRHSISPEDLTLEITETAVLTDPSRTLPVLERLARTGVTLAIDDFGTGYSSLAYLRQLPAQEVKIDKSFIIPMAEDPDAGSLVGGIVRLCHEMGFSVVGEGVEDDRVRDRLAALGCDLGQGYGIARPMRPADVAGWIRDSLPAPQLSGTAERA